MPDKGAQAVGDHDSSPYVQSPLWSCDTSLIYAILFLFLPKLCVHLTEVHLYVLPCSLLFSLFDFLAEQYFG